MSVGVAVGSGVAVSVGNGVCVAVEVGVGVMVGIGTAFLTALSSTQTGFMVVLSALALLAMRSISRSPGCHGWRHTSHLMVWP